MTVGAGLPVPQGLAEEIEEYEEGSDDEDPDVVIQNLVKELECGTSDVQKEMAVCALRELFSKYNSGYGIYSAVLKAGTIKPLVALVDRGTDAQKDEASGFLATLAYSGRFGLQTCHTMVAPLQAADGLEALARLLQHGSNKQQEHAAAALENLGSKLAQDRVAIVKAFGGVNVLVDMVMSGTECQNEFAVRFLREYAVRDGNDETKAVAYKLVSGEKGQVKPREKEGEFLEEPEISIC